MIKIIRTNKGSVLLAVIWILSMLAVFSVIVNRQASQELILGPWLRNEVIARSLAKAGVNRAILELQQDKFMTFDAFNESWSMNEKAFSEVPLGDGVFTVSCPMNDYEGGSKKSAIRYGLCDEESRLNINFASEIYLKNLLMAVVTKMEDTKATEISQAIVDWRDLDGNALQNGAESSYYRGLPSPYETRNAPFQTIEELRMVKGVTANIYRQIEPYVTVYGKGRVNVNTAPRPVLQALGLSFELAQKIVLMRRGGDGKEGTDDDEIFQDPSGVAASMSVATSFTSEDFASIANPVSGKMVDVRSDTFRIRSIGRFNRDGQIVAETMVSCVVHRNGSILYWKEGEFAQ